MVRDGRWCGFTKSRFGKWFTQPFMSLHVRFSGAPQKPGGLQQSSCNLPLASHWRAPLAFLLGSPPFSTHATRRSTFVTEVPPHFGTWTKCSSREAARPLAASFRQRNRDTSWGTTAIDERIDSFRIETKRNISSERSAYGSTSSGSNPAFRRR